MKQASNRLLCLLLAATYVFAYMGFGIHTCHDDGSRHFVWMLGDVSCESIHHHSHDADHDHHHDGRCCSTQVYVITDAQDNAPRSEGEAFLPAVPVHLSATDIDTPPLISPPTRSLLSVWLV